MIWNLWPYNCQVKTAQWKGTGAAEPTCFNSSFAKFIPFSTYRAINLKYKKESKTLTCSLNLLPCTCPSDWRKGDGGHVLCLGRCSSLKSFPLFSKNHLHFSIFQLLAFMLGSTLGTTCKSSKTMVRQGAQLRRASSILDLNQPTTPGFLWEIESFRPSLRPNCSAPFSLTWYLTCG